MGDPDLECQSANVQTSSDPSSGPTSVGQFDEATLDLFKELSEPAAHFAACFLSALRNIRPQAPTNGNHESEKEADRTGRVLLTDSLAESIKARLRNKGISQAELAKKMNVSPPTVNRIVNEPAKSRISTLTRVAQAIGVSLRDLLTVEGPRESIRVRPRVVMKEASTRRSA